MQPDWEKFQEKYNEAPEELRTFLDSGHIPLITQELYEIHKDKFNKPSEITIAISYFILGIIDKEKLTGVFKLTESEINLLIDKINKLRIKFTNKDSLPDAPNELKEKLELRPEGVPLVRTSEEKREPSIPTPPGSSQPLTREAIMSSLTPTRTMANDIASLKGSDGKVHGYDAYVSAREDAEKK